MKIDRERCRYHLNMIFAVATVIASWMGALFELYFHVFKR